MRSLILSLALGTVAIACTPPGLAPADDDSRADAVRVYCTQEPEDVRRTTGGVVAAEQEDGLPTMTVRTAAGTSVVRYQERDGKRVAFGDIVLPPEPDMPSVAAAVGQVRLWPNGQVPYVVTSANKAAVQAGIAMRHAKTKRIQFVPRTNQKDYVEFVRGDGCYSQIGRTGGKQQLSLGNGCEYDYIVAHELGHAIGFWH